MIINNKLYKQHTNMAKYLKLFENHTQYTSFTQTDDFILPNVSHCILENDVHYNPLECDKVIVTYNVENDGDDLYMLTEVKDYKEWVYDDFIFDGNNEKISELHKFNIV